MHIKLASKLAPGIDQLLETIKDPDELHIVFSFMTGILVGALQLDHEHGFGGPGVCGCFATAESAAESSEGLSGGHDGHGEEHTDGSSDEGVPVSVFDEPPASEDTNH